MQVRQKLNEVEHENIVKLGYGLHSFAAALVATFERLSVEPLTPALHETIHGFAAAIAEQPIELLKHVSPTLEELRKRHRLLLVTKGNVREQTGKVERSGLKPYFEAVEVVAEKNAESYHAIVEKYGLEPSTTWMVGNSPKSDINPAIAAGLNAVFIPHADTWILEHASPMHCAGAAEVAGTGEVSGAERSLLEQLDRVAGKYDGKTADVPAVFFCGKYVFPWNFFAGPGSYSQAGWTDSAVPEFGNASKKADACGLRAAVVPTLHFPTRLRPET